MIRTLMGCCVVLSACQPVDVPNETPSAVLQFQALADARQPVDIMADRSTDADGTLRSYTFSFGDGSPQVNRLDPVVQHVFVGAGRFNVRVVVEDNEGATAAAQGEITLVDRFTPPYCGADADCEPAQACRTDAGVCWFDSALAAP